jgi:tetratricopeptide (TPR) repeat protein
MLTGVHPFEHMSHQEALAAKMSHQTLASGLPKWLQEVMLRATHPTPELRFQRMAEFGEAIASKRVPFVLNGNHIKAHALAEKAEHHLARKKWKQAEKLANQALLLSPDCTAALLAAGRCQLLIRRTQSARQFFSRALEVNPRIHVQKELGWLQMEEGQLPMAISLLSDHLDCQGADFEACNLLMKCLYLCARYEVAEDLARQVQAHRPTNPCFENNRFICRLLMGEYSAADLKLAAAGAVVNPFLAYNHAVVSESPRSWSQAGRPTLRDKLVFQEFRFDLAGKANPMSIRVPGAAEVQTTAKLVSIGSWSKNQIALDDTTVSRRHALIANFVDDVWLYDLGSSRGTQVDGNAVAGRAFLDGVHRVRLARLEIEVGAHASLLV